MSKEIFKYTREKMIACSDGTSFNKVVHKCFIYTSCMDLYNCSHNKYVFMVDLCSREQRRLESRPEK